MHTRELIYLLNEELAKARIENKNSSALPFIIRAYTMVVKQLTDNYTSSENITAKKIKELNITPHMKDKLIGLLTKRITASSGVRKKMLTDELKRITGIGTIKANDLVARGLPSIDSLHAPKWWAQLNTDTKTALATQPMKRIPRAEIAQIEPKLINFKGAKIILVGSYRRKAPSSRDIDIMMVSAKSSTLSSYLVYLERTFKIYVYSKGPDKMSLIIELGPQKHIKADVFRTHPTFYYSHLLYATGSKANNLRMRAKAKRMGLLLNQKGLWKGNERILGQNADERAYYKALGMEYLRPEERN